MSTHCVDFHGDISKGVSWRNMYYLGQQFPNRCQQHLQSQRFALILYGPHQAKKYLQTCTKCPRTKCADSNHHAHAQSIIQAFALPSYILKYLTIMLVDSEGTDQTVQMRRLIWAFSVRICRKTCFLHNAAPLKCLKIASH